MKPLPENTVKRLSEYRRTMLRCLDEGKTHIYSYELADLQNITAVQVRRDIMFIGYSSQGRMGYDIRDLTKVIGRIIDPGEVMNISIVGYGNLGKAVSAYLLNRRPMLKLVAAFDIDPKKIGHTRRSLPVISPIELPDWWSRLPQPVLLAAVGARGARGLIRQQLECLGFQEGRDWWSAA